MKLGNCPLCGAELHPIEAITAASEANRPHGQKEESNG